MITFGTKTIGGGNGKKTPELIIAVIGGNELYAGVSGIKFVDELEDITEKYDPNVTDEYPDGLGRGVLYVDGVLKPGYILIRHNSFFYKYPLVTGELFRSYGTVLIPYEVTEDDKGLFSAYVPGII